MNGGRSDYPLLRAMPTRWFDNDIYGHLNNTVHYQLFDTAVNAHLVENGVLSLGTDAPVFLVVESGCRYHASLRFPEVITAGLRVARLGTTSVSYEIALFGGQDDKPAAEGIFVHVLVDRTSGRKVPIPEPTRAVLERLGS